MVVSSRRLNAIVNIPRVKNARANQIVAMVAKHVVAAAFQVSGTLLTRTWMRLRLLRGD